MNIILDTETTGVKSHDQVIELAIIDADSADPLFNRRMRPTVKIHEDAFRVHGIHENFLVGCAQWPAYHDQILEILREVRLNLNIDTHTGLSV